jgi:uncharacterized protein (DUF58 family)
VRDALRGLTTRGRGFLAAGVAAGVTALVLGEGDLLRVAVLLVALPLLSAAAVALTRYRLACHRTLDPDRLQVGTPAQVRLRLENVSRLPTGVMLLEDEVPSALGTRPRFVLHGLWPRQVAAVAYSVRAEGRGRYRLGPLSVRLTDLFGLCEVEKSFSNSTMLTVTPVVEPLPTARFGGEWAGAGETRQRSAAVHGEDDAATREYRHGDDLRKVHWRSTARVGELMVRREEQPRQSRAAVLLDTRAAAHRGDGPASSLEWAVSAAASVAMHLAHHGYTLRLVTDTGTDLDVTTLGDESVVLDHLAEVRASRRGGLELAAEALRRSGGSGGPGGEGLLVAVLGLVDPDELTRLAAVRAAGATCVAVLLDSSSWAALSPDGRSAAEAAYEATAHTLLRAGWHVLPVRRDTRLPDVWPHAAERGAGILLRGGA